MSPARGTRAARHVPCLCGHPFRHRADRPCQIVLAAAALAHHRRRPAARQGTQGLASPIAPPDPDGAKKMRTWPPGPGTTTPIGRTARLAPLPRRSAAWSSTATAPPRRSAALPGWHRCRADRPHRQAGTAAAPIGRIARLALPPRRSAAWSSPATAPPRRSTVPDRPGGSGAGASSAPAGRGAGNVGPRIADRAT